MNDINNRIKELRKRYNLSQQEFGERIGLSKSGVSNIENGIRNVTNKHIKLICSVFDVSEEWLKGEIDSSAREILSTSGFMRYLDSLGYKFSNVNARINEIGELEEYQNGGYIDGKFILPKNERRLPSIKVQGKLIIFTQEEFDILQKNVSDFIQYQIWLKINK